MITIQRGSTRYGPYALEEVSQSLTEGRFSPHAAAWEAGKTDWETVASILTRHGIEVPTTPNPDREALKWLVPVDRSIWAVIAGYAGLFSFIIFPAPIALVTGFIALRHLKKNPSLKGRGRAWFGVIAGGLGSLLLVFGLLLTLVPFFES